MPNPKTTPIKITADNVFNIIMGLALITVVSVIFVVIVNHAPWLILPLIIFTLIALLWALPTEGKKFAQSFFRIKDFRRYKIRSGFTIILLLVLPFHLIAAFAKTPEITILSDLEIKVASTEEEIEEYDLQFTVQNADRVFVYSEKIKPNEEGIYEVSIMPSELSTEVSILAENGYQAVDEEIAIDLDYPLPEIEILNDLSGEVAGSESYVLEFKVKNATEVLVDGEEISAIDGIYKAEVSLLLKRTTIGVVAKNKFQKEISWNTIIRGETAEEISRRKAKEAEQLAWDRSKAGKLCKKYSYWSETDCKRVANGEHWIGMRTSMLIESRGRPNSANPSDYGYGKSWQYCWHYLTPSCFYDENDDHIIDSYN